MTRVVPSSARHLDPEYKFDIYIRKVRWLPLYVEQWLVPRFVLKIENTNKGLDEGEVDCEFVQHDDVASFPLVETNFKDFDHIQIRDFKKGDTIRRTLQIESRFIRPGRYMLRLLIKRWEPASAHDEFGDWLKKTDSSRWPDETKKAMEMLAKVLRQASTGTFRPIPVYDWRWLEVIKVHDVATFARVMGGVIMAAVSIAVSIVGLLFFRR